MDFNELNSKLYLKSARYRFTKEPASYYNGFLKIFEWLSDIFFNFEQKKINQKIVGEKELKVVAKLKS